MGAKLWQTKAQILINNYTKEKIPAFRPNTVVVNSLPSLVHQVFHHPRYPRFLHPYGDKIPEPVLLSSTEKDNEENGKRERQSQK